MDHRCNALHRKHRARRVLARRCLRLRARVTGSASEKQSYSRQNSTTTSKITRQRLSGIQGAWFLPIDSHHGLKASAVLWASAIAARIADEWGDAEASCGDAKLLREVLTICFLRSQNEMVKLIGTFVIERNYFRKSHE